MEKYRLAYNKIKEADNILLLTHQRPDGDALSSMCAFTLLLDRLHKNYAAFCYDRPSAAFHFLPNIEKITTVPPEFGKESGKKQSGKYFSDFDLIIILDCGSIHRTGLGEEIIRHKDQDQFLLEFDHHPKVEDEGDLEIRKPEAASTTEVLYYFFQKNNITIDKDIANCILTGILTDTANFLHPTTTKNSMNIASKMLLSGAYFPKITKSTWQNKTISSMKLWGIALDNLKINKRYNIAFTVLTLDDIEKYKENGEAFDSIAGFLSNIGGELKAVLFLREEEKGKIKGSLRAIDPTMDVSKLANYFGGGGHAKASGFMIEGSIEKTEKGWKII
ncbi:MAG: DHH family phosphoesterase [Patescibacteria group bacterium]